MIVKYWLCNLLKTFTCLNSMCELVYQFAWTAQGKPQAPQGPVFPLKLGYEKWTLHKSHWSSTNSNKSISKMELNHYFGSVSACGLPRGLSSYQGANLTFVHKPEILAGKKRFSIALKLMRVISWCIVLSLLCNIVIYCSCWKF